MKKFQCHANALIAVIDNVLPSACPVNSGTGIACAIKKIMIMLGIVKMNLKQVTLPTDPKKSIAKTVTIKRYIRNNIPTFSRM
jgi:hypothetical protein